MNDQYVVRSLGAAVRTALPALVFLVVCAAYSYWRDDFGFLGLVVVLLVVFTGCPGAPDLDRCCAWTGRASR